MVLLLVAWNTFATHSVAGLNMSWSAWFAVMAMQVCVLMRRGGAQKHPRLHELGVGLDDAEGAVLHLNPVQAAAAALRRRRLLPVRQPVPEGCALHSAPCLGALQARPQQITPAASASTGQGRPLEVMGVPQLVKLVP